LYRSLRDGFYPDTYAKIVELSGGAEKAVICVAPMASCSLKPSMRGEFNAAQTWYNKWEEAGLAPFTMLFCSLHTDVDDTLLMTRY
jgi:hypothetical protein